MFDWFATLSAAYVATLAAANVTDSVGGLTLSVLAKLAQHKTKKLVLTGVVRPKILKIKNGK